MSPRGPKPGKGGRPVLPPGEKRSHWIRVGVNDIELAALDRARQDDEALAACVRRLALEVATACGEID